MYYTPPIPGNWFASSLIETWKGRLKSFACLMCHFQPTLFHISDYVSDMKNHSSRSLFSHFAFFFSL